MAEQQQTIGDRIRQALDNAGMNQAELARRMRVERATVSKWIGGTRAVGVQELQEIARILQVPIAWLIKGERATCSVVEAINADPHLSADAKRALIEAYEVHRKEAEAQVPSLEYALRADPDLTDEQREKLLHDIKFYKEHAGRRVVRRSTDRRR